MQNEAPQKKPQRVLIPVLFLVLLGLGLILFDRDRIIQVLSEADWELIPLALTFAAGSNFLSSLSYALLAARVGIRIDRTTLGKTYFVTNAMNRVIGSGGAAGFSLRYLLLKPFGVGLNDVLNSSFIHFLLSTLIMFGMLPVTILYILVTLPVSTTIVSFLIFTGLIGVILGFSVVLIVFNVRFRWNIGRVAIWFGMKVFKRDFAPNINNFTQRATVMVTALEHNKRGFSMVMLMLFGEWCSNVMILRSCLNAFGPILSFPGTASLYVLGTMIGGLTGLPGGIGVQEAVMTTLAILQGLTFEQATLSAILYRVLQAFLPFLFSIGLYPRLLKSNLSRVHSAEADKQ